MVNHNVINYGVNRDYDAVNNINLKKAVDEISVGVRETFSMDSVSIFVGTTIGC